MVAVGGFKVRFDRHQVTDRHQRQSSEVIDPQLCRDQVRRLRRSRRLFTGISPNQKHEDSRLTSAEHHATNVMRAKGTLEN